MENHIRLSSIWISHPNFTGCQNVCSEIRPSCPSLGSGCTVSNCIDFTLNLDLISYFRWNLYLVYWLRKKYHFVSGTCGWIILTFKYQMAGLVTFFMVFVVITNSFSVWIMPYCNWWRVLSGHRSLLSHFKSLLSLVSTFKYFWITQKDILNTDEERISSQNHETIN